MPVANDTQVGGNHYREEEGEQHWDRAHRLRLDYFQAQITKYVERCWLKNGVQDLEKAQHFIAKYIELSKGRRGATEERRKVIQRFPGTTGGWEGVDKRLRDRRLVDWPPLKYPLLVCTYPECDCPIAAPQDVARSVCPKTTVDSGEPQGRGYVDQG